MAFVLLNPKNKVTHAMSRRLRQNGQCFTEVSLEGCGDLSTIYFGGPRPTPLKRPSKVWFLASDLSTKLPQWLSLSAFTEELEWVNSPQALAKSNALINQLHIADICGFVLPECIVTTDVMRLNQFHDRNQGRVSLSCQIGNSIAFEKIQTQAPVLTEAVIMRKNMPLHNIIRVYVFKDNIISIKLKKGMPNTLGYTPPMPQLFYLDNNSLKVIKRYSKLMRLEYLTIDLALTPNSELLFLNGYASEHIIHDDAASPEFGLINSLCQLMTPA